MRTGLLVGDSKNNLHPTDNATRAQLATMLTRIAVTGIEADLSAFQDVSPSDWYYTAIAKAVALGLMKGASKTKMKPGNSVTREETFVMLARMFGVRSKDKTALYSFKDWKNISSWAACDIAAMVQAGYVKGTGKKLNPKGKITRQEIAQVICNILDDFGAELDETAEGSYALSAEALAPGTVVDGDLLFCTDSREISLQNVTVTGRLVIQGAEPATLVLEGCSIETLVLCRDVELTLDGGVEKIVSNTPSVTVNGAAESVEIWESTVTVNEGATVQTADLMTRESVLRVLGRVETVNVLEKDQTITGTGSIGTLNVYQSGLDLSCPVDARTDDVDLGLTEIQVTKLEETKLAEGEVTAPASVRIENLEDVLREYDVSWSIRGKEVYRDWYFLLQGSGVCAADLDFSSFLEPGMQEATLPITFTIRWNGETRSYTYEADVSEGLFHGIGEVNAIKQETTKATVAAPKAAASVKLTNMPLREREYTVAWYAGGKKQYSEQKTLGEGSIVSANLDFSEYMSPQTARNSVEIVFEIKLGDETRRFSFQADTSDGVVKGAAAVRTQNIQAKVLYTCPLYGNSLYGQIGTVSAGTWVTYILYNNQNGYYYSAKIRLPNGTVGWVKHSNLQVSSGNFYVTWDYSTAVKEYWVNNVKKASSSSGYLIWTSLYTQKVNIFTGYSGHWKLVKSYPCSSGLNTSNTPPEDKTIQSKTMRWNFSDDGNYYVDHVTVLDSRGRAFHSRPKYYSGAVKDATMGRPSSHGCVRMMDDGVQYIYNNCPIGTKVVLH